MHNDAHVQIYKNMSLSHIYKSLLRLKYISRSPRFKMSKYYSSNSTLISCTLIQMGSDYCQWESVVSFDTITLPLVQLTFTNRFASGSDI